MDIEKAKEMLKRIDIKFFLNGMSEQSNYIVDKADEINTAIETVLNELEYKQDDINVLQAQRDSVENQLKQAKAELEKKDKIIDEMAEEIRKTILIIKNESKFCQYEESCKNKQCKECIKQYFERKVDKQSINEK